MPISEVQMDKSRVHVGGQTAESAKTVAAARFKAECLRIIEQMGRDREPVTITRRGRAVAVLAPVAPAAPSSIIGALKGSVLRYEDPFGPASPPEDWNAGG
jgi:antitoxin (DNA-binding transcriptional repressor) of toxin-antitoxin stability system